MDSDLNFNQQPLPKMEYSGMPEMPKEDRSNVSVLNPQQGGKGDGLQILQNSIRTSAKGTPSLTQDLFSSMGSNPQKQRFETLTDYKANDLYATQSDGERVAKYENYIPGTDNNERLASQQSTGDKWVNGLTKSIAKVGSAVLGGTAGLVYGVGAALSDGSFSSIYDNSFSNTLADWDAKLSYELPNLYTKQEQEKGLFGQIGTANFWADKFFGGLSFTAGAIISEGIWAYATGGLSLATSGARLGTRIGRWGVESLGEAAALQGVSKYKGLYKEMMENTLKGGLISKTTANNLGKAGELASSVGILARSAGYEASVEAVQYKREATESFHQNFLAKNGREPSYEESQAFHDNLDSSANAVFGVNMAILMPSNLVTMGHVLGIKSPIKTGFSSFIDRKAFGYGIEKVAETSGKASYKVLEATTGQKVARRAFNYLVKPAVTEGLFEEGMQGVATKTANKWLEHTYDTKHSNSNLDTMGAFYESLGEQYGTKEGWVETGLGMLIGVVGGSINARSEEAQRDKELTYEADVAETFQTSNLQSIVMPNRLQSANRMAGFSEEAKVEAQKGNVAKSSLAQKSAILTFINAKMVMGENTADIVKDIKFGLDSTTDAQWAEAGVEADQIEAHKEESLKDFENLAKQWKANKTYWGYMIGKKVVGEGSIDTPVIGSDAGAIVEALAWQSTIGETANTHMKEAQDVLGRELGSEYASAMQINSSLKLQKREFRQQLLVATRSFKVETTRRDALVVKIAKLNAAPKQPEAANKPAGKQAAVLTQSLLETEQRLQELNLELEGYAEQVNKASAYESSLKTVDITSQELGNKTISGQDLISLQDNIEKFGKVLDTLQETNPQRADYLSDLLKEYSDSEQVFLENQATQRAILNPDFKIEQINSWAQGKVKKNTPMNENTKEWFERTLKSYEKTKVEALQERDAILQAEGKNDKINALKEELVTLDGQDELRAAAITKEIEDLEKSPEEKVITKDKGEVVVKSREQEIEEEIAKLEEEKQQKLSEVKPDLVINNLGDLDNLSEEQRKELKERARQQINSLPDDVFFLTHLTQTVGNLESILANGLNAPVLQGTTNTSVSKEDLLKGIEAIIDGKVRHANASNLVIIAFPKSIVVEGAKKADYVDAVENYLAENHPEDFGQRIPLQYNVATFSNGEVNILGQPNAKTQNEQSKESIISKYDSKIETLKQELAGKAPSPLEVYKKRIAEALKKSHNYLTYMGDNYDDVANKKPTKEEVEEFKKLREEKKFNTSRYQELEQKLSDWKLLDSAVDEQYVSIGDLILGIEQFEQEVEEEETLAEITPEDAPDIIEDNGLTAVGNMTRYDILQNTNGAVTVKRKKDGTLTLHHLKLSTIAQKMGVDFTLTNKNGEDILFGEEEVGSILTIEGVEFKVVEGNAIAVKEEEFMPLQSTLNMYPLNTGAVKWSYSDIYTKVGDDFVKMESDFKDNTINSERIYELQEGDILSITINNDGYNAQLLAEYEATKGKKEKEEALKKLKKNLKLNATTTKGIIENVSILKATRAEVDQEFMRIREKAFEAFMAAEDKSNVKVGVDVVVDGIFLGSPRFSIAEDGKTQNSPISERGAKEIVATGYIQNGEVVLNREVKDVNKTFVGQLSKKNSSKKIPVVVFKRGNYNVAYPVSMTKTDNDLSGLFDGIIALNIADQEKVRRINQEIQTNGLETEKLLYEDISNDKKLEAIRKAFEEKKVFVTAEEFSDKNYNIKNVVTDASINIDLEDLDNVLQDAKLRIKLDSTIKYRTDRELKYETMTELENQIDTIARELYKDYVKNASTKYIKANGDIIEDTGYTDTLDDTPIETPANQLDKVKNINTLRKAFQGLNLKLKEIIGKDKITKVSTMFKQYDFIKSQLAPSSSTLSSGISNSSC